jgi:hypothetical protein
MPNVTPVQVIALLTFVLSQIVAIGKMDNDTAQSILQIAGIVVPAALAWCDAHLRGKRATAMATIHVANAQIAQATGIDAKPDPEV